MNSNPLNGNMHLRDAVIVATVLMLASIATMFLPQHNLETWETETAKTAYDLIVFAFSSWITSFVALTGLSQYAKDKEGQEVEPS